jgi:hypothetical protein
MALWPINSRINQRERIFDFGPKEAILNAKTLLEPLQQVIRHKKISLTNNVTKIQRPTISRRVISLKPS